jgi:hypothetical protein
MTIRKFVSEYGKCNSSIIMLNERWESKHSDDSLIISAQNILLERSIIISACTLLLMVIVVSHIIFDDRNIAIVMTEWSCMNLSIILAAWILSIVVRINNNLRRFCQAVSVIELITGFKIDIREFNPERDAAMIQSKLRSDDIHPDLKADILCLIT